MLAKCSFVLNHLFGLTSPLEINAFVAVFHLPSFREQGCSQEFLSKTLRYAVIYYKPGKQPKSS